MTTLAAQVTAAGISAPSYADILASIQATFRQIYGADIYIAPDSKDGQLIAFFAQAISDANDSVIAAYAQFSPATATAAGLSSVVKTNGITRLVPTNSTAVGNVVGQAGTVIYNGVVTDTSGNSWALPATVTIPTGGSVSVTVTAQTPGAIVAPAGTIDTIATPARGWQSFTSTADATPGAPTESDATLRKRQAVSTSLPALTPLGALLGALENLVGVTRVKLYDNDTSADDANGVPAHSICAVVEGGNITDIVTTIGQKKTPGGGTYGTTSGMYADPVTGIAYTIKYYVLALTAIKVRVTGTALTGYTTANATDIQNAISAYIDSHNIGESVEYSGLTGPAYNNAPARLQPYKVTNIEVSTDGGTTWITTDVAIAFNHAASCAPTDVTVNIA